MTNDIHIALLCKKGNLRLLGDKSFYLDGNDNLTPASNQLWMTGDWVVAESKHKDLLNKTVVLTSGRNNPTYIGGTITDVIPKSGGRVVLVFTEIETCKGLSVPNWKSQNPVFYPQPT